MASKFWAFFNWGILVVVTIVAVWMVWGSFQEDKVNDGVVFAPSGDCVDVSALDNFDYEACYDAYSEMIFLKVSRGGVEYQVNQMDVSFVGLVSQFYELEDVPGAGENGAYKLSSKKNPGSIDIRLSVVRDFDGFACGAKNVFVDYCPAGTGGEGVDVSISPIEGVSVRDFIEVEDFPDFDSDIVVMDLVEKEAIWESTCKSSWDCGDWEVCEDDTQHRDCKDLKGCSIPTDSPATAQKCDGSCVESWECEWGGCEDGYSVPKCDDSNSCGTSFEMPTKLSCEERGKCAPNVVCSDWSECSVDYDFIDLVGMEGATQLEGGKSRICVDKEGCVATTKEEEVCSVSVDIYTKRFEKCGEGYVGVYDVLDDSTLAILKEGKGEKQYLNIYFDDQSGIYCDYCFDGKKNGDEEDVDCGGSCRDCEKERYVQKKWWEFIFDF